MDDHNPFLEHAESAKPAWQARKERIATKRSSALIKKHEQQDELRDHYKRWQDQQQENLLSGQFNKELGGLIQFLDTMTPSSAPALVKLIERSTWLKGAPAEIHHATLMLCSRAISRMRVKAGLAPFDDALWDEPPKAWEKIRDIVRSAA